MKTYNCTIEQNGLNEFVSTFQIRANNLKEAKSFAKMQKTNYFQRVNVKLAK